MQDVKKFFLLPSEEKIWLLACLTGSIFALFSIHTLSLNRLSWLLGDHLQNRHVCSIATQGQISKAWRIGRIMESVSKRVPWQCACLSQALCVKWLLNQLKIPSVFYLGAKLDNTNKDGMKAHAWICVGPRTVIGAPTHRNYQVTATFATLLFKGC